MGEAHESAMKQKYLCKTLSESNVNIFWRLQSCGVCPELVPFVSLFPGLFLMQKPHQNHKTIAKFFSAS